MAKKAKEIQWEAIQQEPEKVQLVTLPFVSYNALTKTLMGKTIFTPQTACYVCTDANLKTYTKRDTPVELPNGSHLVLVYRLVDKYSFVEYEIVNQTPRNNGKLIRKLSGLTKENTVFQSTGNDVWNALIRTALQNI